MRFNVSNSIATVADPYGARNMKRLRVKVNVRPINGQMVCGQDWPHGESEQVIYVDQYEREVKPLVQTDDETAFIKLAEQANTTQKAAYLRENKGKTDAHYAGSAAAEFYRLTGRGMSPLISCEVLGPEAAPETPESRSDAQIERLGEQIGKALQAAAQLGATGKSKG